jgi:hypothetical protein
MPKVQAVGKAIDLGGGGFIVQRQRVLLHGLSFAQLHQASFGGKQIQPVHFQRLRIGPMLCAPVRPRWVDVLNEFREHLPYTCFAALAGVGLLSLVRFFADLSDREDLLPKAAEDLFHTFHFFHLFLSAVATTAMFWRYDRRWMKAVAIGILGAALPCGASDIAFPLMGGQLMGIVMKPHICFIDHPFLVWPFLLAGVLGGLLLPPIKQSTHFAHGTHVLFSSAASVLYLVSFGVADWLRFAPYIFFLLIGAVLVPCCTSDIVFPLLLTRSERSPS